MNTQKLLRVSLNQTLKLGEELGKLLRVGDVVLLRGDLGVGKTTLVRGIASGLGYKGLVRSPSFNLMFEIKTKDLILRHCDFMRLKNEAEVEALGASEWLLDAAVVVEWPEVSSMFFEAEGITLDMSFYKGKKSMRRIALSARKARGAEILSGLTQVY